MMKRWADHLDVIAGENIVPYKSNNGKLRSVVRYLKSSLFRSYP